MTFQARLNNNPDKIFRGLVNIFSIPEKLLPTTRPTRPAFGFKVGGAAIKKSTPQAFFLTGGADPTTAADTTVEVAGTVTSGARIIIDIPGVTINSAIHTVTGEYTVQSGDTTLANIATKIVDLLKAINDSGASIPTGGNIYCTDKTATRAQIATGTQALFDLNTATPVPFVASSATITITAKASLGAGGNDIQMVIEAGPVAPSILTPNASGFIAAAGLRQIGHSQGAQVQFQANEQDIDTDQSYQPVARYVTTSTAQVTFNALQDRDAQLLRTIAGLTALTGTAGYEILVPNYLTSTNTFALAIVSNSLTVEGGKDLAFFYQCRSNSLQFGEQKQNQPISCTFTVDSDGEDSCYIAIAREGF